MIIPKQILEIALANGWLGATYPSSAEEPNLQGYAKVKYFKNGHDVEQGIPASQIIIDPYFWEALARGLHWERDDRKVEYMKMHQNGLKTLEYAHALHDWQLAAHECLQMILVGIPQQEQIDFWQNLLESKE